MMNLVQRPEKEPVLSGVFDRLFLTVQLFARGSFFLISDLTLKFLIALAQLSSAQLSWARLR